MRTEHVSGYLPLRSLSRLSEQASAIDAELILSDHRSTKHGDFRQEGSRKRITVNNSLNQFHFLITLVHEMAHAVCTTKHGWRIKPHGPEWKHEFRKLLYPHIEDGVFPHEIASELVRHMKNPKASTSSDHRLLSAIRSYDAPRDQLTVNDLKEGDRFSLEGRRIFEKGKKNRTRHVCKELSNGRTYLISGIAEVQLVKD